MKKISNLGIAFVRICLYFGVTTYPKFDLFLAFRPKVSLRDILLMNRSLEIIENGDNDY